MLWSLKQAVKSALIRWSTSDKLVLTQIDHQAIFIPSTPNLIEAYIHQPFEPYALQLFKSELLPGSAVLDIGAHIGVYALIAARQVGPKGRVFAFEPDPANFSIIERNIKKSGFKNILQVQKVVSNSCGMLDFFLAECSDCNSLSARPGLKIQDQISVESVTIDAFLAGKTADVIKMDVEGQECKALEGMRSTITNSKNMVLFVEMNPACLRSAGASPEELISLLADMSFQTSLIDEDSATLVPVPGSAELARKAPEWYGNLYCTK